MDELSVVQKVVEKFGVWAALPLLIAYMLYRYGMAGIALVPVWIDKIKSDADAIRKRADLEMELMNARHAQECAVVISTGEAVRVAIPNAIHEMQVAMSAAHESVKAGHERIEAGHERIEKKIDASHARIEQKLDSLTGPRRVPPPAPSVPS